MLEWNEVQVLDLAARENRSIQLNPRMGLKAICFLPGADAETSIHTPAPKHPAEDERLFQALCAEKKIRSGHSLEVRDSPREPPTICITGLRMTRIPQGEWPLGNSFASPEAKQAHGQPRNEQRRRSFEHNSTLKSAQTAKPAPRLHHRLNP